MKKRTDGSRVYRPFEEENKFPTYTLKRATC